MAIAEFSKFAGILSAALSLHHLLGFEIAQLEFHHLHRSGAGQAGEPVRLVFKQWIFFLIYLFLIEE